MIREELELDGSAAEQTIDSIDQQLQRAAELFKVALADAVDVLSAVQVTADVSAVAPAITGAVEAADSIVPVEADVSPAQSEVDAFEAGVAAQDAGFTVVADLGPAQSEVDAFEAGVAALAPTVPVEANTDVATSEVDALLVFIDGQSGVVSIEADTADATANVTELGNESQSAAGGVDALQGSVTAFGAAAAVAGGSATELVGAVGELGGGEGKAAAAGVLALTAATGGFFEAGLNAVSAGQRFDMILGAAGESIKRIDVNGLDTSMEKLGLQFGSTAAEMENVNSKLYQNAINAGISSDKAQVFTKQVESLAARAISLNPQLGTLADVASQLGDKLARGARFAQTYGIQLTPAEIATRALADTGKTAAADLTVLEKSMAGAELASEKYGSTLAGTVAKGSQNAAVQMESLKATFKEAIEQIGVPLVAPVLDLIREAEPDEVAIAATLGNLATEALPLVSEALALIGPPLQVVLTVIQDIPAPVIQAVAAFYAMTFAIKGLGTAIGIAELEIPPLAVAVGLIAGAVAVWSAITGDDTAVQQAHTKAVDEATQALSDLGRPLKDRLDDAIAGTDAFKKLAPALADAGLTVDDLAKSGGLAQGQIGMLNNSASKLGISSAQVHDALAEVNSTLNDAARNTLVTAIAQGKLTKEQVIGATHAKNLDDALAHAKTTLENLQTTTGETVPLLAGFSGVLAGNKGDVDAFALALMGAGGAANEFHDQAKSGVIAPMGEIVQSIEQMQRGGVGAVDSLSQFAIALNDPRLTSSDLQAVADRLGVSLDTLKTFAKNTQQAVEDLVSSASKNVPTIADVFAGVKDKITANSILKELQKQIQDMQDFTDNVNLLISRGMLSAAKAALDGGPAVAAAIAKPIKDGNNAQALQLEAGFEQFDASQKNLQDNIKNNWGPALADGLGTAAANASIAFAQNFDPNVAAAAAMAGAAVAVTASIPGLQASAFEAGSSTGSAYSSSVTSAMHSQLPGGIAAAAAYGIQAGMSGSLGVAALAGAGVGTEIGRGISVGLAAQAGLLEDQARAIAAGVASAARAGLGIRSPSRVFMEIGKNVMKGLSLGITTYGPDAVRSVENVASDLSNVGWPAPSGLGSASHTVVAPYVTGSVASSPLGLDSRAAAGVGGSGDLSITFVVDARGTSPQAAAAVGDEMGRAFVDRVGPTVSRRLAKSVQVIG